MLLAAADGQDQMSKELEAWLSKLGLDQYAPAFHVNAIDMQVVTDLTDVDLVALGVAPLGHRKRLLNAIAALRQSQEPGPLAGVGRALTSDPKSTNAERRQVSVLFCDVVGSTALAHRLDPEELAQVMDRYHKTATEQIRKKGGHVAQLQGDGVMAYFGWPTVHEDDAERAVAAGLDLVGALPRLSALDGSAIAVRVGVATGLVVIGGEIGGDGSMAMGETPNIAARLQAEAEPNTVLVLPLTARLAGRSYQYKTLGKRALRGVPEPLEVLEVTGKRSGLSRFKALRARSAAPLVGRTGELELLLSRWQRAYEGEGQIVLLSGDAGIGKSRLVQSIRERVGPDVTVLRYQCSPLHQQTALFPVIQLLIRSIGILGQQTTINKLAKVREWLPSSNIDATEYLPLLCYLLGIESSEHRLPDLTPKEIRERTVALLSQHFMGFAKAGPVLAIVEDAHWGDPTSEEALLNILNRLERAPVMVLATNRDRFSRHWQRKGYTTELHLDRLSGTDSRLFIRSIVGDRLSEDICESISERAEGVPLFLEELTLALLEARNASDLGKVPMTLQALLAARLDGLGDAKQLLQLGAVLGRQFQLADIQAIARCSEGEVRAMAERTLETGLVHQALSGNDRVLRFKHALVQDAAYASLLNVEKRRLHVAALMRLEQSNRSAIAGDAIVLALHAERGEVWDKAAHYIVKALAQAVQGESHREAVGLYERAVNILKQLQPDKSATVALEVHRLAFGPLRALADINRLVEIMQRGHELAHIHGDKRQRAGAASRLSNALWLAGKNQAGLLLAAEAVQLLDELDDFALRLSARFNHANLLHATGAIREAADNFTAIIDNLVGDLELKRYGWPGIPSILARGILTWSLVTLGEFDRAKQIADRASELVDYIREPYSAAAYSRAYAHMGQGLVQLAVGRVQAAIASFEAAHRIIWQADLILPLAADFLGAAYTQGGRPRDALALLLEAERSVVKRLGDHVVYHHVALAEAHLALGDLTEARTAIGRAQDIAERAGELAHLAHIFCLRGSIVAADPASDARAACAHYQRAIELARPRGLRPLVAQCLAGMAKACEVAGDVANATNYSEQAQHVFDELGLPSNPSLYPRQSS
jgi:class 3 adenylate cyclase/tetratricopeptide (TPR) repeat protein